jgi:aryl-phospho-beta-D-glucosidase BglC (GH1 family)
MRSNFLLFIVSILLGITTFASCKKEVAPDPVLVVSPSEISFEGSGGVDTLTIESSGKWTINNSAYTWLQLSTTNGDMGTVVVKLTVASPNVTGAIRSEVLVVSSENGQSRRVKVSQAYVLTVPSIYPSYNISPQSPDETGMSSNAVELAAKMKMGINFGNTMESPAEGDWQSSKLTESYVKFVKQTGFNAVRIPCGWVYSHLSDPEKMMIDPAWLNRVKEVVGWCVANDMYVVLNAHGDWGWLENNVNKTMQDSVNAKQKAIWEQIATTMRDFDEHLIFAGANEPAVEDAEGMAILNTYHQTFINAVRATGGKNSYRVLVVQGPTTDCNKTYNLMNTLPEDPAPKRLMVEVHNYTPSTFTILTGGDASWGNMTYYWGAGNHSSIEPDRNATWGEEDVIIAEFQKMKQKFVDKGIPVVLGEYAAFRRTTSFTNYIPLDLDMHNQSIDYWTSFVTKQAKEHGLLPFYWEQGPVLDRKNNVVLDQGIVDALIVGSK